MKAQTTVCFCVCLLSHPAWVRGLKFNCRDFARKDRMVAPRVGAWIEMAYLYQFINYHTVAPRVGAWIEIFVAFLLQQSAFVAPRVGAWIEIRAVGPAATRGAVAPRVGAWIEMV